MSDSRTPRPAWACVLLLMAPSGAQAGWPAWTPRGDANRDDIPAEYRWDLSHLYADAQAWEKHFAQVETRIPDVRPCAGTLSQGPARLRECLDLAFDLTWQVQLLGTWAEAVFTTRRTDPAAKARSDRIQALHTRLAQATAWIEPELLEMDPATLRKFVAADPGLAQYDHYIDDLIRRRPHVLTKDQERLLALSGDLLAAPESIHGALEEDVPFPKVRDEQGQEQALTFATFPKFRTSPDRQVRQGAVDAFLKTMKAYGRSFAASLDAAVKAHVFIARARGYDSALVASVDQNAVPVQVYETLLEVVHKNLPATLHRYVELRRRTLGLDQVHYYDLYVPMFPKARREVPYGDAVDMVRQALRPLGADYLRVLDQGLAPENGWVDVFPAKGKRPGAYCNAAWRRHPIVFLNHMNELEDAFTLAHEFGHALHFHLAGEAQPFPKADAPIFLAEIASTFNEELLLDHLLKQARSRDERLALLNKRLENLRTTIFRQAMFAEFEKAIHEEVENGGALTAERMAEIYEGLVRTYYGPDFAVGPEDGYEWAYIPHFYYNFYVYQYSTGLISAIALAQKVLKGDKGAVARYLDFLKAGGSDYPVETLKRAGVDLTRPESMQAAFDLFARTLDEIEALTRKPK
ncbi:oligoendopeptidase F [Myxococcota bacterium]|nr:oligoendopeptidase F [Myxococcota bacterium]